MGSKEDVETAQAKKEIKKKEVVETEQEKIKLQDSPPKSEISKEPEVDAVDSVSKTELRPTLSHSVSREEEKLQVKLTEKKKRKSIENREIMKESVVKPKAEDSKDEEVSKERTDSGSEVKVDSPKV